MKRAYDVLSTLVDLVRFVGKAIADGKPERVEAIIPDTLRTSLARAKADADLEDDIARRRAMTDALPGAGQP